MVDFNQDVAARFRQLLVEQLGADEAELLDELRIVDDLGADSLDAIELVMATEEAFGLMIPDEDFETKPGMTVGEAVRYLKRRLQEA